MFEMWMFLQLPTMPMKTKASNTKPTISVVPIEAFLRKSANKM